jgi:hypothetical protein
MDMQELEITIDNDGRVQVVVKGVQGGSCVALTRSLEDAIGDVLDRSYAPEFYSQAEETTHRLYENNRKS